jgi:two-component system OmpR family sensor kinase/two-component system sensor histidine kinase QseC
MISVRRRLLAGLLALVVTVDGLAGVLSYRRALHSTGTILDYQLRQMALSLRDQGAATPQVHIPAEDQDFVVQIWNSNGSPVYSSRPDLPFTRQALLGYTDLSVKDESWRAFALQTAQRVILVAQPWRVREALAGHAALRTLAPLLVLTPLLAVAIWWMVVRTLAPIRRVASEVQHRDADSLSPVAAQGLPLEIEPLVSALNRLLERLAGAFQAQRAFIADAAHELRSPLTAVRLQLQLLGRAHDEAERQQALDKLGQAVERASLLVQQLLTLARSEAGGAVAPFAPLPLDTVVREGVTECASLAVSRGTDLALEMAGAVTIHGDADALRVLVRNLADNAIRYTPQGGRVLVRLDADTETGAAQLEVEDSGPGIPPAERERVFARFYRGAGAIGSGSGLGLAIVAAVAGRHRAQVRLGQSPLGGLKVTVRFPPQPGSVLSSA